MKPHDLGVRALAEALHVSGWQLHVVLRGRQDISIDLALRPAGYFGSHPDQVAKLVARQRDWVTASLIRNMVPLAQ